MLNMRKKGSVERKRWNNNSVIETPTKDLKIDLGKEIRTNKFLNDESNESYNKR